MGVKFEFMDASKTAGKSYAAQIEDLLMFLLIWGEAANLRHMPECLCFLYHKTMRDHKALLEQPNSSLYAGGAGRNSLYPGHYLDHIITPIYEVVAVALKSKGDHEDRYCTVLYCTVLYCTVLYCTVLHRTAVFCYFLFSYVLLSSVLFFR